MFPRFFPVHTKMISPHFLKSLFHLFFDDTDFIVVMAGPIYQTIDAEKETRLLQAYNNAIFNMESRTSKV